MYLDVVDASRNSLCICNLELPLRSLLRLHCTSEAGKAALVLWFGLKSGSHWVDPYFYGVQEKTSTVILCSRQYFKNQLQTSTYGLRAIMLWLNPIVWLWLSILVNV